MGKPKYSVITTAFNGSSTIEDAFRSVHLQSMPDWEMIIVDDGSTDSTFATASGISKVDSRVRVLRLETNVGLCCARNRAVFEAKGEFLTFLDCDDELYAGYLERASSLIRDFDLCLFGFDFEEPDPSGQLIVSSMDPTEHRDDMMARGFVVPFSVVYRRELVDAVGGFNEMLFHLEDWDLVRRIIREGARVGFFPHKAGLYHYSESGLSKASRLKGHQVERINSRHSLHRSILESERLGDEEPVVHKALISRRSSGAFASASSDKFGSLLDRLVRTRGTVRYSTWKPGRTVFAERLPRNPGDAQQWRANCLHKNGNAQVSQFSEARHLAIHEYDFETFLHPFARLLEQDRPDFFMTLGIDQLAVQQINEAKRRDAIIAVGLTQCWQYNLFHFINADYIVVPSLWARDLIWSRQGISTKFLPLQFCEQERSLLEVGDAVTFVGIASAHELFSLIPIIERIRKCEGDRKIIVAASCRSDVLNRAFVEKRWTNVSAVTLGSEEDWKSVLYKSRIVVSLADDTVDHMLLGQILSLGRPLVARYEGPAKEFAGEGGRYVITPSFDGKEGVDGDTCFAKQYASAILKLLNDDAEYTNCREAALSQRDRWPIENALDQWNDFIKNARHQGGPPIVPLEYCR